MELTNPVLDPAGAEEFIKDKLKRELSPNLLYHGYHHTEDVLVAALRIAEWEGLKETDTQLLRIAVLFHDCGFLLSYKNHEERSCDMAKEHLPRFGFQPTHIDAVCGMIMATKIPQLPKTEAEKIICDADLDYLGRDDFYTIGRKLFEEFTIFNIVQNEKEWNKLQIRFLENHSYFTQFSKQNREPLKQKYLAALKETYP